VLRRGGRGRLTALGAAAAAAPGAVLGLLVGQLLFFLNPHLPFETTAILRAGLVYGGTGGLVSWALAWSMRPWRPLAFATWGITFALGAVAGLAWFYPSRYAFYLPTGINDRLVKAAIGLTVCAVVGFYTVWLHTALRRPYGRGSRLLFLALVLLASLLLLERRNAFPAPPQAIRSAVLLEESRPLRLVVVGLETASLEAILPMAQEGTLPFLARALEGGTVASLRSLKPNRFGALWSTLATGRSPYGHGIVGTASHPAPWLGPGLELRLLPGPAPLGLWASLGRAGRPLLATDRKALALWEILTALQVPASVVGWPISAPLPPGLRLGISDRFLAGELRPGAVEPASAAPTVDANRRLVRDLAAAATGLPESLEPALAEDLLRLSLALPQLDEPGDRGATLVLLPGLREANRRFFGGWSRKQFEGLPEQAYTEAADALRGYYVQLDSLLADLWERQTSPTLLVVVSAYGMEDAWGLRRVRGALFEEVSLAGYLDRSPPGLLLLLGPGIREGGRLTEARLVDVLPTLLYAAGLPIARDLEGKVLRDAFSPEELELHPQTFVPSYEGLRGQRP
jgi:hypothetical protein